MNKNKDVNAYIRKHGDMICYFLIEDIEDEMYKYIGKYRLRERFAETTLKRIGQRKEILLNIVNSGLLQENAITLVSDFVAALDVSAIANAVAVQPEKDRKRRREKD